MRRPRSTLYYQYRVSLRPCLAAPAPRRSVVANLKSRRYAGSAIPSSRSRAAATGSCKRRTVQPAGDDAQEAATSRRSASSRSRPRLMQVEELLLVDAADGRGVSAAHVIGLDLEAGDRVRVRAVGQQQVAALLKGVGAAAHLVRRGSCRSRPRSTCRAGCRERRGPSACWERRAPGSCRSRGAGRRGRRRRRSHGRRRPGPVRSVSIRSLPLAGAQAETDPVQ